MKMNDVLKHDLDALWTEALPRLGFLERRGLNGRRELIYELVNKYIGPRYDELAAMKGATLEYLG